MVLALPAGGAAAHDGATAQDGASVRPKRLAHGADRGADRGAAVGGLVLLGVAESEMEKLLTPRQTLPLPRIAIRASHHPRGLQALLQASRKPSSLGGRARTSLAGACAEPSAQNGAQGGAAVPVTFPARKQLLELGWWGCAARADELVRSEIASRPARFCRGGRITQNRVLQGLANPDARQACALK